MPASTNKTPSLVSGAPLTPETWADFVSRLRHHCVGAGLAEHCTAHPLFRVLKASQVLLPRDVDGEGTLYLHDGESYSPLEMLETVDAERKTAFLTNFPLFASLTSNEQADLLTDHFTDAQFDEAYGFVLEWTPVCDHLTEESANAFVAKHRHHYKFGVKVSVESSYRSHELNALRQAILDGRIGLLPTA